ncbi:GNAT family N-acetyltransferase [Chitinophagaceae bacterium MMS25-I14]
MKIFGETERLLYREIQPEDDVHMFTLDSDPLVHRYLGGKVQTNIEQAREVIRLIRDQYATNGIGRWAVIEKRTGNFTGWAGLKLMKTSVNGHINFHDVGYRFIPAYWGKGYATEAARASVQYGFETLGLTEMFGITDLDNLASFRVLQKAGLQFVETFDYGEYGTCNWLEIKRNEWNVPGLTAISD